jgi:hypothetical protein
MLEARSDEDGDGADDHGGLVRQRSGEHRDPHGKTDQHVRQDTRCQRRERRLVQLRINRRGSSVADRSCCVGSTSIPMRWAGQHSLPDLVLRSRVLGRGNLGRHRYPVPTPSRRMISALCASVRELIPSSRFGPHHRSCAARRRCPPRTTAFPWARASSI